MSAPGLALGLKRTLDLLLGTVLTLIALPLLLVTALLVFFTDFGPIFYRQLRAGVDGRPFHLLKFRSMRVNDLPIEAVGQVTGQHPLVTPIGRVIRRLKIDELPQLFNVLAGHMSLVGPRPAPLDFILKYDDYQRRRLSFRPGMTGWTQVNGGVGLTWDERILLDVWYIDHWSLWFDLRILLRTAAVVLFGERPKRDAVEQAAVYAREQLKMRR